jgi:hypothetical protein
MKLKKLSLIFVALCWVLSACSAANYLKGGMHRDLDEDITIVELTDHPEKYLNKTIVFSVRFFKKGDLPCPLGEGYVNLVIADRVSYITLDKVWMKKDKAGILDELKEMETIIMRAKIFKVDGPVNPNLEALEIIRE